MGMPVNIIESLLSAIGKDMTGTTGRRIETCAVPVHSVDVIHFGKCHFKDIPGLTR